MTRSYPMTAERFAKIRESMVAVAAELNAGRTSQEVAEKYGVSIRSVRTQFIQWSHEQQALGLLKDGHDPVFVAAVTRLNIVRVRNLQRFGGGE